LFCFECLIRRHLGTEKIQSTTFCLSEVYSRFDQQVNEWNQHYRVRTSIHINIYSHLILIKLFVSLKALSLNSPSFVEYLKAGKKMYNLEKYNSMELIMDNFKKLSTNPLSRGCRKLDACESVHNTIHHSCLVKVGMCLHMWWTGWKYSQPKKDICFSIKEYFCWSAPYNTLFMLYLKC
jgi:hypothetical protein